MTKIILGASLATASLTAFPAVIYQLISSPKERSEEKLENYYQKLDQKISEAKKKIKEFEEKIESIKKEFIKLKSENSESLATYKKLSEKLDFLFKKEKEAKENKTQEETQKIQKEVEELIQTLSTKTPQLSAKTQELYQAEYGLNKWKNYLETLYIHKKRL